MITIIIPEWLLWIVGVLYFVQIVLAIWQHVAEKRYQKNKESFEAAKSLYYQKLAEFEMQQNNIK